MSVLLFHVCLAAAVALGWIKGGAPEKIGAKALIAMVAIQWAFAALIPREFQQVDPASVVVDLFGLLVFGWLALNAKRFWPVCAAALELICMFAHGARALQVGIDPLAYGLIKSTPTGFAALALAIGTLLHLQRIRSQGVDLDWQDWDRLDQMRSVILTRH